MKRDITQSKQKGEKRLAWALGFGLALFAMHWREQPGLDYIFLPQIGLLIVILSLAFYFIKLKKVPELGPKYIWIPMLLIVVSIAASSIINSASMSTAISQSLFGIILFALYIASRQLGKEIFVVFIPFVALVAISCIVSGLFNPGVPTGGIITNYCASIGFMIFGTVVNKFKWQWVLATLVLVAIFFAGALEGLVAVAILGIIILIRKDWSRKLLLPIGVVAVLAVFWLALGHLQPLWGKDNFTALWSLITNDVESSETTTTLDIATTGRWSNIANRMGDIKPFGRGFWITMPERTDNGIELYHEYSCPEEEPVHNVPLVIVDQIGPVAGVAWLFITIFCLVKTRWKYAWSAILILSVFDHFIWTQLAPYWWVLAGVSTVSIVKNDYIFKEDI